MEIGREPLRNVHLHGARTQRLQRIRVQLDPVRIYDYKSRAGRGCRRQPFQLPARLTSHPKSQSYVQQSARAEQHHQEDSQRKAGVQVHPREHQR